MKKILIFAIFSLLLNLVFAQDEVNYLSPDFEFEVGKSYKLFGDKVKLRSKPSTDSEIIDTLYIASTIEIVKKSKETMLFNGIDFPWYKVKFEGKSGYILGGLISMDEAVIGYDQYLVSMTKEIEDEYDQYKLLVRLISPEATHYFESKVDLYTTTFSIEVYDGKGVPGVSSMIYVNLLAEACGVDGGGTYLFHDGTFFDQVLHVSAVSEAGLFHFSEEVIFPEDENGVEDGIIFIRESSEIVNEDYDWDKTIIDRLKVQWVNHEITPDPNWLLNDE